MTDEAKSESKTLVFHNRLLDYIDIAFPHVVWRAEYLGDGDIIGRSPTERSGVPAYIELDHEHKHADEALAYLKAAYPRVMACKTTPESRQPAQFY